MKNANILFIRHADVNYVKYDKKGKYIDLSPQGWNSSVLMADEWSLDIDSIFTSPLNRCIETILPLSLKLGMPYKAIDCLQELDYKGNASEFHKKILTDRNFCYKDGETIKQANDRFESCKS